MAAPSSFENVTSKWYPEIKHHCPDAPLILVGKYRDASRSPYLVFQFRINDSSFALTGTKIDLREDRETLAALADQNLSCIRREQGQKLANKIRAVKYMECSALTQRGLKQVRIRKSSKDYVSSYEEAPYA